MSPCSRSSQTSRVEQLPDGNVQVVFALVVNVGGKIKDRNLTVAAFEQAYKSIQHFHPGSHIIVVDNASPAEHSAAIHDFVDSTGATNTLYVREDKSGFEIGGYRAALEAARKHNWNPRVWVFLQGTMVVLKPLPLNELPCEMTYFIKGRGGIRVPCNLPEHEETEYRQFRDGETPRLGKYMTRLGEYEFRRLRFEFPAWKAVEPNVCGKV